MGEGSFVLFIYNIRLKAERFVPKVLSLFFNFWGEEGSEGYELKVQI